jgi:hypothetical protein
MKRFIICGDRNWSCEELASRVLGQLIARHGRDVTIVHGNCSGVDQAFYLACIDQDIGAEPHPADWDGNGQKAGPIRNAEMVSAGADACLVFHRFLRNSKGSKDCARKALAAGIPVWLCDSDTAAGPHPVRLTADSWQLKDSPAPKPAFHDPEDDSHFPGLSEDTRE